MRSEPIFKKSHLADILVLTKPGTFKVKVFNTIKPEYLIEDDSKSRYLVNLKVAELPALKKSLETMEDKEEIPFCQIKNIFKTGTIWENNLQDTLDLPVKNEEVIANFDYSDYGNLVCKSITLIPRESLAKFELSLYCKTRGLINKLLKL